MHAYAYTYIHTYIHIGDTGVAKRFLVVRSSHGLSNTQIEEITGLLVAIVTRRALILDFSNDTYTGQRPVMEYDIVYMYTHKYTHKHTHMHTHTHTHTHTNTYTHTHTHVHNIYR
jgi:hypothetical protein